MHASRTASRWLTAAIFAVLATAVAAPSAFSAAGKPPKAVLTVSPNPAQVGQIVSFSAGSSSGDGQGGNIAKYEWDLDGDGTFEVNTGTTGSTARGYGDPDTIPVILKITDTEGDTATSGVFLRINGPPKAGFIYQP